ncbi:MAG: hypothetical protein M9904_13985 [Chitinophagaceae bacterium]|nr:hypothetical protein [Chitinophagaceae bacterium]
MLTTIALPFAYTRCIPGQTQSPNIFPHVLLYTPGSLSGAREKIKQRLKRSHQQFLPLWCEKGYQKSLLFFE